MSTYTYNTFLNQYTDTDSNLQIIDTDGVIKFTINPYSILTTMISNNLLTFKIKSGRLISIPFSTMNESKIALILAEERIQLLINKTPNFIDKQVEKYVEVNWSSGVTGATGATGATGPAVSGEPLTIPMIDFTGSGLTNSIITQGDGYVEIDSMTMSASGLRLKNLKNDDLEYVYTEYTVPKYMQGMVYYPVTNSMYSGKQYDDGKVIEINEFGRVNYLDIHGNIVFLNPFFPGKLMSAKTYQREDSTRYTIVYKWSPDLYQEEVATFESKLNKDVVVDSLGNMYFPTSTDNGRIAKVTKDGVVTLIEDVSYSNVYTSRACIDNDDNVWIAGSDSEALLKIEAGTENLTTSNIVVPLQVARIITRVDGKISIIGVDVRQGTAAIYETDGIVLQTISEYESCSIYDVIDNDGNLEYLLQDHNSDQSLLIKETYDGIRISSLFISSGLKKTAINFAINTKDVYYFTMPYGTTAESMEVKSQPVITVDELGNVVKDMTHPSTQEVLHILKNSQAPTFQSVLSSGSIAYINKEINFGIQGDSTIRIFDGVEFNVNSSGAFRVMAGGSGGFAITPSEHSWNNYTNTPTNINVNPSGAFRVMAGGSGGFAITPSEHSWNNYTNTPTNINAYSGGINFNAGSGGYIRLSTSSGNVTISGGGQTAQTIIDGGGLYVRGGVSTFNNGIYSNRMMVREGSSEEMNIINNERSININSVDKVVVTAGDDKKIELNSLVYMKVYTVGELPSVVVGTAYATVIDADSPVYMTPIVGGGSVTCPVFYNGVEWLAH